MDIRKLSTEFSVSPQIAALDVREIAALGFKSMICNRPDGEAIEQAASAEIADQAARCGLEFRLIPVTGCNFSEATVAAFKSAMACLPKPILGYCRSGTRSTNLWALAQAATQSEPELLSLAKSAGYDLSALSTRLKATNQTHNVVALC